MSGSQAFPVGVAGKPPGRNDPCPCGSGRKFKQCCAIAPRATAPAAFGPLTDAGRKAATGVDASAFEDAKPQPGRAAAPRAGRPPQSPAIARMLANAKRLLEAGRVLEAVPLLHQAARQDPADPRIWVDLGAALIRSDRVDDALKSLAHAIVLDDTMADTHYHLGMAFARKAEVSAAIDAFRAAIARAPKLAEAHFRLAELLQSRGLADQAAASFERAAAAAPNTTTGRLAAAWVQINRGRPDEATAVLRRARALDPKSVEVIQLLANTAAEAGRFEDAERRYHEAIALRPNDPFHYYKLTSLRRFTPRDRPLMERMAGLLASGNLPAYDRMLLHFGLGKAHDDLNEFEPAIGQFDAANRIRGATAPFDRAGLVRSVDRNIELFPGANGFDASLGVDDERPVFVLGLPRSGTTLVEQIVSSHPAVAAGGELGFWSDYGARAIAPDARPLTRDVLHELAARYQAVLRDISPHALRVTNKNPFNFLYIGLLHSVFPRALFIHCRRHPLDNCLSIYTNYFAAADTHFMGSRENLVFYHGEYSRLMRHWRAELPPERFLDIDYEVLVADPEAETRRLISFCQLEWDDACLRPDRNARAVATASSWQVRQPVYRGSVERWRNYQPWLGPLADLLPDAEHPR